MGSDRTPSFTLRPLRCRLKALLDRAPEFLGDDSQFLVVGRNPLVLWPGPLFHASPRVALLRPVPHDHSRIERPIQHLSHRRRTPASGSSTLRPRCGSAFLVQPLGYRRKPGTSGVHVKDPSDLTCLVRVHSTHNVRTPPIRAEHFDVVVAEHASTSDMARSCLASQSVVPPRSGCSSWWIPSRGREPEPAHGLSGPDQGARRHPGLLRQQGAYGARPQSQSVAAIGHRTGPAGEDRTPGARRGTHMPPLLPNAFTGRTGVLSTLGVSAHEHFCDRGKKSHQS